METLAIIAYRQPVMKEDVDKIRGVDSSHFIRGLLEKRLISVTGRSDLPGRPMLYATTTEFLEVFTLPSLDELPPLAEIEKMVPSSESMDPNEGDPRVRQMRQLFSEMKSDRARIHYDPQEDERFLSSVKERVSSTTVTTPTVEALDSETPELIPDGR